METIEILGDTYLLRKALDIVDYQGGIYGFDVFDSDNKFLTHYDIEDKNVVISEIKWDIYRILF